MKIKLTENGLERTLLEIASVLSDALNSRSRSKRDRYISQAIGMADTLYKCVVVEEDSLEEAEDLGEYDRYNPHYPNK